MLRTISCLTVFLVLIGSSYPGAFAEDKGQATVWGDGTVVLRSKPAAMRVKILVAARAKTLDAALERLNVRREAAVKKLAGLGAEKDSIVVGTLYASKEMLSEESLKTFNAVPATDIQPRPSVQNTVAPNYPPPAMYNAPSPNFGPANGSITFTPTYNLALQIHVSVAFYLQ